MVEQKTARRIVFALLSGLALAISFAPYPGRILAWVAVGSLMNVGLRASGRIAFLCGFLYGAAFFGVSLAWNYTTFRVHGGIDPVPAGAIFLLMVAYLSLYPAVFSVALARLARRSTTLACLAAPFLWVALEFARTHFPIFGFPWNQLGYAISDNVGLVQLAAFTGIYGLTFLVVAANALWVWVNQTRSRILSLAAVLPGILLAFAAASFSHWWVPAAQSRYVTRLVQTNFAQEPSYSSTWMDDRAADLDEIERLSARLGQANVLPLVIWPEVPAPFYFQDQRFAARADRISRSAGNYFLAGVIEWHPGAHGGIAPRNSAVLLAPSGQRAFVYDKIHLVPFGEYVPFRRLLSFADKLTAQVGDFQAGKERVVGQLPDVPGPAEMREPGPPRKFAVLICYEAVFPDDVRRFVREGGAELLVNLSNDGWLSGSTGPEQHLAMARVRAVENRRWLLRATNTGHTVSIDPYGRIAAELKTDVRGALDAPYDFRSDQTLYTRFGDWFAWLCVAVSGLVLVGHLFIREAPAVGEGK